MTGPYVGVPINDLPLATNLTGVEPVPIVQSGQTRQTTAGLLATGPTFGGTVKQISTGAGLSGGAITVSGKIEVATSGITTSLLANNAVTYAKMQNVGAVSLLGNPTSASANVSEITLGPNLSFSGNVLIAANGISAVNLTMPNIFTVTGSPITTGSGTFGVTFTTQAANLFFAGPASGSAAVPTFRALSITDIPSLSYLTQISTGTGLTGGPITGSGTIYFANVSPLSLWANPTAVTGGPVMVSVTGNLTFSGNTLTTSNLTTGTVTQIVTQSGISGGPITLSGTIGIANNGVTNAMIRTASGFSVIGRSISSDGNVADITGLDQQVLRVSGTTLAFGAVNLASASAATGVIQPANFPALTGAITTTAGSFFTTLSNNAVTTSTIANGAVTYAKIQNESASTLLGNPTTGSAAPSEITLGSGLSFSGTTLVSTASSATTTISNADGSITISSVTGATLISLATNHVNGWTGQQYFAQSSLTDSATISWNLNTQQAARLLMTAGIGATRVLGNPSNMQTGGTYTLIIVQDTVGSRALTYSNNYKWPGGSAPVLSTASSATDILTFLSDGTSMFGVIQKAFS